MLLGVSIGFRGRERNVRWKEIALLAAALGPLAFLTAALGSLAAALGLLAWLT